MNFSKHLTTVYAPLGWIATFQRVGSIVPGDHEIIEDWWVLPLIGGAVFIQTVPQVLEVEVFLYIIVFSWSIEQGIKFRFLVCQTLLLNEN